MSDNPGSGPVPPDQLVSQIKVHLRQLKQIVKAIERDLERMQPGQAPHDSGGDDLEDL